jgi:hypothetical protein
MVSANGRASLALVILQDEPTGRGRVPRERFAVAWDSVSFQTAQYGTLSPIINRLGKLIRLRILFPWNPFKRDAVKLRRNL